MKNLVLLVGIISSLSCLAGTVDTIPANDTLIEYTGRIDFSNPLAPKFSYSGVSIRACFSGTSIAAIMDDDIGQNYYNIILDGKMLDTIRIGIGKKTYKLAEGLENIKHEIEIFKRTEQQFGKTQFFGFVVDKGTSLSAIINSRNKLMEYIGNSITCGYGNEGKNGGTFGPTTENHYLTYAAITSRNFNARHLAVCKSGIGVYRNYDGPPNGNSDCMTNYYTRTYLYDENPKYSFAEKPDLVCIDLGTNDFSTTGGDSAKFVNNYFRLIDTIQKKYTMPDIICLLGPMLSGTTLSKERRYIKFVADSANLKGKGDVHFFEMSAQTGDLGIAIDYHPTVAQHKRNAQELTDYIKSVKGWKIQPMVNNASVIVASQIKVEFNTSMQDDINNFPGLEVLVNDQIANIDSVYLDSSNSKILNILMQKSLNVGEKINLNYIPGTIASTDSILVQTFNSLNVQNNLTETKITKASTNSTGTNIILAFNKKININSVIDGLTITNNQGIVAIDSFKIINAQLTLYCNDKLIKGDSVFASYSGSNLYGTDEIALNNFQKLVIKNNSVYTDISIIKQNAVDIYPNPNNSDKFYYRLEIPSASKNIILEVYNTNGTRIYSQNILESEGVIDLNKKIINGVYIFKFILDDQIITKSIIKE
jgi:hypothetical protein